MALDNPGISLGDAVLSVLVDLSQFDAAMERISSQTAAKLAPAGVAVASLGEGFDQASASATAASVAAGAAVGNIQQLAQRLLAEGLSAKDATSALTNLGYSHKDAAVAVGLLTGAVVAEDAALKSVAKSAAVAGTEMEALGAKGASSFVSTRVELQAVDQMLGVRIPRGVTSLLAQLPGVGAAIEAAFSVAVIFFVVEALVKVVEAVIEFRKQAEEVAAAWKTVGDAGGDALNKIGDQILEQQKKIDELNHDHLAVLRDELELLDHASLKELGAEFGNLATQADAAFTKMEDHPFWRLLLKGETTSGVEAAHKDLDKFIQQFNDLARSGDTNQQQLAQQLLSEKVYEVTQRVGQLSEAWKTLDVLSQQANAPTLAALRDELGVLTEMLSVQTKLAEKKQITTDADNLAADQKALAEEITIGEARVAAATKVANSINDVELQQALIRNSALKISYLEDARAKAEAEETKYQNTVKALGQEKDQQDQKLRAGLIDEDQYAAKVEQINGQITTTENEQLAKRLKNAADFNEARQQLNLKNQLALQNQLQEQLVAGYPTEKVDSFASATDRLALADLRLADAQKNLALTNIAQNFGPQEAAITALANFGIITENQKAERLRVLYQQEENDALKALNDLAAKEKTELTKAQAAVDTIMIDPIGHQAELDAAQKYLDQLSTKYDATQKQILSTTATYEAKRISLQRGSVAEAIAMATAEGNALLASQIKESQATTDLINEKIRLAKARGDDITALQKEQKETEKQTQALVNEASKGKDAEKAITEWVKVAQQGVTDIGSALNTAASAIVSGQESLGKAMEAAILDVISKLAQHWADYYAGLAIAALAGGDFAAAAGYTAASAALEIVAGAVSGLASSITSPKNTSASSSGTTPNAGTTTSSATTTSAPQPVQTVNAAHLAGGGLITKRTMAVIGDAAGGGSSREAVIPLGQDSAALDEITDRLYERMGGGGDTIHHHWNIQGMVSADTTAKFMKQASQGVRKGSVRFTAANSFRITRRG
jgi:hypothetical protein